MKMSFAQLAIIVTVVLSIGVLMLLVLNKNSNIEAKYREVVNVFDIARSLDLDIEKFQADIDSEEIQNRVSTMKENGTERLGGRASTPAVFVNGDLYNLRSFEEIKADLELVKTEAETDDSIVFPVKMEVFIDYNCPYCASFEDVAIKIKSELSDYAEVDTKHLPFLKSSSNTYAYAAESAREQGKFDEFTVELFNKVHGN